MLTIRKIGMSYLQHIDIDQPYRKDNVKRDRDSIDERDLIRDEFGRLVPANRLVIEIHITEKW